MTTPRIAPDHAAHDRLLIAGWAAGDASGPDAVRAEVQLAACPECRALANDLRAIAAATRVLPAPRRSRDFRLTPETAARLRPASPLWRFVDSLLAPRGFGRPLAAALTTLGLAGLLIATLPSFAGSVAQTSRTGLAPSTAGQDFNAAAPEGAPAAGAAGGAGSVPAPGLVSPAPGPVSPAPGGVNDTSRAAPASAAAIAAPASPVGSLSPGTAVAGSVSTGQRSISVGGVGEPTTLSMASGQLWLALVSGVLVVAGVGIFAARRLWQRGGSGTSAGA